jgi:voltage-gated potassium channel
VTDASADRTPHRTRLGLLAVEVLALVAVYFLVPLEGSLALRLAAYAAGLALVVLVIVRQLRRHLGSRDADIRVDSLALAIVFAILLFALTYYAVDTAESGEFSGLTTRIDALYYSLTVATTTGFGDVSAQGQLARFLVSLQLVFNIVILATAAPLLTRTIRSRRISQAQQPPSQP